MSDDSSMRQAYVADARKLNPGCPAFAFWATAKLPVNFEGVLDVKLVVNDGQMHVIFPEAQMLAPRERSVENRSRRLAR